MKIAIVGGAGKFGQHMAQNLEENHQILISDANKEKAEKLARENQWVYGENKEIASEADCVIISVPIKHTVDVIHEVGPHISEDTLITDVTSVKVKPVEAMKEYSDEVLGMHPMYAPTNSIKGQKIVLCPAKGDKWEIMRDFWETKGAETHITDIETHDKAMSIVQGLMHFSELVVAETIRKSEMTGDNIEDYSSPVYQLITDLTARMLNQKSELYGSIQSENPENEEIRQNFIKSAEELRETVTDEEKFSEKFEELGEEFNLADAQSRTDSVIEFLSNDVREK